MNTNDTISISECPTCGSGRIAKVKKTWDGEFKGKKYTVPALEYFECPDCNEKIYDRLAMHRIQEHSPVIQKRAKRKAA